MANDRQISATVGVGAMSSAAKKTTATAWHTQIKWTRDLRMLPVRTMIRSDIQPATGISASVIAHGITENHPTFVTSIP